ncbi:MAG TPA: hypothetical protein VFW66_00675 [Gemmatimonadales bacterium]|nr:hypothetical protein [Gemmatimonadales bacterium]
MRKLLASLFCASILCVQAKEALSTFRYNNWYWPFVNYPMYSDSHRMGDSVVLVQVRAVPCGQASTGDTVTFGQFHVIRYNFEALIQRAAQFPGWSAEQADTAQRTLDRLAQRNLNPSPCHMQIWARTIRIGRNGPDTTGSAPKLLRSWSVAPDSA